MAAHLPPCALVAPLIAVPFMAVATPLWFAAIVVCALLWALLTPLDWIARLRGGRSAARAAVGRWLHWLTHPSWPEKWTRKG